VAPGVSRDWIPYMAGRATIRMAFQTTHSNGAVIVLYFAVSTQSPQGRVAKTAGVTTIHE
jgi:hypothetical protein